MKTSNSTLNPFNIFWTAFKTDGRKITKACAKDLKKADYFLDTWGKTEFCLHQPKSIDRASEVKAILDKHGYTYSGITITDKQFGRMRTDFNQELYTSFKEVATTKQKAAAI